MLPTLAQSNTPNTVYLLYPFMCRWPHVHGLLLLEPSLPGEVSVTSISSAINVHLI